jgi:hypothetical protein
MRKIYIYEVIRYYPNINGDEFFNVGIRLSDKNKQIKIQFIEEEHLSYIYRFPSIKKQVIDKMIEELKTSESSLNNWYGNYVRFSGEKLYRSKKSFDHVMQKLYEDFIGYKFNQIEKIDKIKIIKEETKKMLKSEFGDYLKIVQDNMFDFVIESNNIYHRADLGSIGNREHVNRMIWQKEEYCYKNTLDHNKFDFLNISSENRDIAQSFLQKNEIETIDYDNDESRYNYLRELVQ